ncbi:MAG TPA: hypothetical protein VMW66_02285 [Elusimicrobiales bacterium]|nr:hypothetical protein [Elusimicrobiales bacterium]
MFSLNNINSIGGVSKRGQTPSIHVYNNTNNDDVSAADYFNGYYTALSPGDILKVVGVDKISEINYVVKSASSVGVVVAQILVGAIGAVTTVEVTATLAEINAGKTLVALSSGKQIRVTQLKITDIDGTFVDGTQIEVEDDETVAIQVATYPVAGLVDNTTIDENSPNVVLQAGYLGLLTVSKNLVINKGAGADFTGGTSITLKVSYQYV